MAWSHGCFIYIYFYNYYYHLYCCYFDTHPQWMKIVYIMYLIQPYVTMFVSHRFRFTVCDKVCQWLVTGRWFCPGTPLSSTNKTDRHDITEILLKAALNTINHTPQPPVHWSEKRNLVGWIVIDVILKFNKRHLYICNLVI
jgi:hypothetical protein